MRLFSRDQVWENLVMALDSLRVSKLRSALTILGVVIGVATVRPSESVSRQLMLGSKRMCPLCITPSVTPRNRQMFRSILQKITTSAALVKSGCVTTSSRGAPARL